MECIWSPFSFPWPLHLDHASLQDVAEDTSSKRPRLTPFIAPHVVKATSGVKKKQVNPAPLGELLIENYASGKNPATTVSGFCLIFQFFLGGYTTNHMINLTLNTDRMSWYFHAPLNLRLRKQLLQLLLGARLLGAMFQRAIWWVVLATLVQMDVIRETSNVIVKHWSTLLGNDLEWQYPPHLFACGTLENPALK